MLKLLKYGFLAAVGVFVCYHYWPRETVKTGHKIVSTSQAAYKAGKAEVERK